MKGGKLVKINLTDVINHEDFIFALCTFIDEFKRNDNRHEMIELPPRADDVQVSRINLCVLAAAAHKLANDYKLSVPGWVHDPQYKMPYPVFAFDTQNKEYQEFLIKDSPQEFSSKNIFHGASAIERV